jgi:hypothetical protein
MRHSGSDSLVRLTAVTVAATFGGHGVVLSWRENGEAPRYYLSREPSMLTIAVILLVLWLLGLVSSYTIGGFIHILLVVAIVMFLVNVIQGRRPIV